MKVKAAGADKGVVHFNLHVNLDHHQPEPPAEKEQAAEAAKEEALASPWRPGYNRQVTSSLSAVARPRPLSVAVG